MPKDQSNEVRFFGVKMPKETKESLLTKISKIENENEDKNQKNSLYFFYSEFLLRANRNPNYKDVLNKASLKATDGKGLNWCHSRIKNPGILPKIFTEKLVKLPIILRFLIMPVLFVFELIINSFKLILALFSKSKEVENQTENEVILGRDLVYDILKIADEKKWKVSILGSSLNNSGITEKLQKLYPQTKIKAWSRPSNSCLMQDEPIPFKENNYGYGYPDSHTWLTRENLFELFPDLLESKDFLKEEKPDLVLVCFGGASGKQEFFIDNLMNDNKINFKLAVGLGAALDHLGAGKKQIESPEWLQKIGLEWAWRLVKQPYRRVRVLDSILTLIWWTTMQEFLLGLEEKPRKTAICIVKNKKNEYLLVQRRNWLAGDIGWTFVQGEIKPNEDFVEGAKRELLEEAGLKKEGLKYLPQNKDKFYPNASSLEFHPVSTKRFTLHGMEFNSSEHYLLVFEYTGEDEPKLNWENADIAWVPKDQVEEKLSMEKRVDWKNVK